MSFEPKPLNLFNHHGRLTANIWLFFFEKMFDDRAVFVFELLSLTTDRMFFAPEAGLLVMVSAEGQLRGRESELEHEQVLVCAIEVFNSMTFVSRQRQVLGVTNAQGESVTLGSMLGYFNQDRAGDLRFEYNEGGVPKVGNTM